MRAVFQLLAVLVYLLELAIIARILLSYFPGIDPRNPLVRFLHSIVDPILRPFRRVLPTLGGIDFTPLLVLLLLAELQSVLNTFGTGTALSPVRVGESIVANLVIRIIFVFCFIVLLRVIVSLFNADPFHPLTLVVRQLSNPLIRPFAGIAGTRSDVGPLIALAAYVVVFLIAVALVGPYTTT